MGSWLAMRTAVPVAVADERVHSRAAVSVVAEWDEESSPAAGGVRGGRVGGSAQQARAGGRAGEGLKDHGLVGRGDTNEMLRRAGRETIERGRWLIGPPNPASGPLPLPCRCCRYSRPQPDPARCPRRRQG